SSRWSTAFRRVDVTPPEGGTPTKGATFCTGHVDDRTRLPRIPAPRLARRAGLHRGAVPPHRHEVPGLHADVHGRRAVEPRGRALDALVRRVLPRHPVATAPAHRRRGLAAAGRAVHAAAGAAPPRPRRPRPGLPVPLDVPALVPADRRRVAAAGADRGGPHPGPAPAE